MANQHAAGFFRGYRYKLVDGILEVGDGTGPAGGPSRFFNVPITYGNIQDFNDSAKNDARYKFNANAVNLYVTTTPGGGGLCSFPSDKFEVVWINNCTEWWVLSHEIGHYYNLFHTHQGEDFKNVDGTSCPAASPSPAPNQCTCAQKIPGNNDLVADTVPDNECWNRDQLSMATYSANYAGLTSSQKILVDDTYFNIMSYHQGDPNGAGSRDDYQDHFSELQLDRATDAANNPRSQTVSGKTHFVSLSGNDANDGLLSTTPRRTVAATAASLSAAGEIILARVGSYNETVTINKPVTLRVPRGGHATIGSSTNH